MEEESSCGYYSNELLVRKIETNGQNSKKLYKRAQKIEKTKSDIKEHKDFKRSMRREVSAAKNCCPQKVLDEMDALPAASAIPKNI